MLKSQLTSEIVQPNLFFTSLFLDTRHSVGNPGLEIPGRQCVPNGSGYKGPWDSKNKTQRSTNK